LWQQTIILSNVGINPRFNENGFGGIPYIEKHNHKQYDIYGEKNRIIAISSSPRIGNDG